VGEGRSSWRAALWGAGCGMLGGLLIACLYYLYEQLTRPNPYYVLTLIYSALIFPVFGGIVGLLAAAWYTSD
jgi:hypothetical protein